LARFLELAEQGTPREAPPRLFTEAAIARELEYVEASIRWTKAFLSRPVDSPAE
jgi:hypothetical protein